VELKKDAVHERDIVRGTGLRRRVKSFAMPAVERVRLSNTAGKKSSITPTCCTRACNSSARCRCIRSAIS
jgi:hypothetical protein